jgi:hypothetical protein
MIESVGFICNTSRSPDTTGLRPKTCDTVIRALKDERTMERRPTTQDITWFLDLGTKLNLAPPYQRRSVWTKKDRVFFVDTILRDYPTAPVFLHKTLDAGSHGTPTYHVVDGKQRLDTILMFSRDELRVSKDFGDSSVDGKKFSALPAEYKHRFWNYILTVEFLEDIDPDLINQVFDRLNRNSRSLTRQELRHARHDGAFIRLVEAEADSALWAELRVSSVARARRMRDVEFIAELFLLTMHGIESSEADKLDQRFADYDEEIPDLENVQIRFEWAKSEIAMLNKCLNIDETRLKNFSDFYSLFAAILSLYPKPLNIAATCGQILEFLEKLENEFDDEGVTAYLRAVRGAANDAPERNVRAAVI